MAFNRRHLMLESAVALTVAVMGRIAPVAAEPDDAAAVKQAVEAFRKGMLASDRAQLEPLIADQASLAHSNGRVENKTQFIDGAVKAHYLSLVVSDETDNIVGSNAISRFTLTGDNESEGKINALKLGVLLVWLKQDGRWKLLAGQPVKI